MTSSIFFFSSWSLLVALLLLCSYGVSAVRCPHCSNQFASCNYNGADLGCPTMTTVATNAATIVKGIGTLSIASIIAPRFLRLFRQTHLDSLLHLIKRPMPGTAFSITMDTTASALLNAVQYGLTSTHNLLFAIGDLLDEARAKGEAGAADVAKCKDHLDLVKTLGRMDTCSSGPESSTAYACGILSFVWGKVSIFVMNECMDVHRVLDISEAKSSDNTSSTFTAKIHRAQTMEQFSEMMNLFAMYAHALSFGNFMVMSHFYEHAVYDTIRLRHEAWSFSQELLLIMFRRVEDSGGKITLSTVYEETYLNTVMDEARVNHSMFFRPLGGNPKPAPLDGASSGGNPRIIWNNKFSSSSPRACPHFNLKGRDHPSKDLLPDGTCKFNHTCNKWVSHKGKNGQCRNEEGTAGHAGFSCDHSKKQDSPVP